MDKYSLVGVNGNVFAVICYVKDAMRKEGISYSERESWAKEALALGDYNKILCHAMDKLEVLNIRYQNDYDEEA